MGQRTAQHRRGRLSLVAFVVTLASLVLVGWAVRGLLLDPLPATADFGSPTVSVDLSHLTSSAADSPFPAAARSSAATSPPTAATPAAAGSPATAAGAIPEPGRSSAAPTAVVQQVAPVRLSVPSLEMDVALDAVGIAKDGQMQIPEDADRAGWYQYGATPGADTGSVVVAGHVDSRTGPGAFLALTKVREGAEVVVESADGTSTTYRVIGSEQLAKGDLAVQEIFRRDGDPVLRLVTCTGDWSPRTGHYTDNLVITAAPLG